VEVVEVVEVEGDHSMSETSLDRAGKEGDSTAGI